MNGDGLEDIGKASTLLQGELINCTITELNYLNNFLSLSAKRLPGSAYSTFSSREGLAFKSKQCGEGGSVGRSYNKPDVQNASTYI